MEGGWVVDLLVFVRVAKVVYPSASCFWYSISDRYDLGTIRYSKVLSGIGRSERGDGGGLSS